ncbi:GIY-YIG nuclease family protein [Bisgaard Taxon 45]
MKIQLNWYQPIELGSSSTLRNTLKDFDFTEIPEVAGIYMFYREKRNGGQEALYVGQSENIRRRFKQHSNSLALVEGLENTPQGTKMFIFAEIQTRGGNNLKYALKQAERGYIQYLLDNDHPLLNKKLLMDEFDLIVSVGDNIIDLVSEDIDVFTK